MRLLLALLLLLPAAGAADEPAALDVLASLLDDGETRDAAARRIDALGVQGIPLLDGLRTRVRSDEGQKSVLGMLAARGREIRGKVLAGERDWFAREVAPRLRKVSDDALLEMRLGLGPAGEPVLYFDARTFEDPKRLTMLEYLVCPVRDGKGGKDYECLAGMEEAEWKEFARAFAGGRAVRLRWVVLAVVTTDLASVLRWAEPSLDEAGLKIGGNHDESGNRGLPADGQAIQVGVVIR
jgi:hypothetical protein